MNKGRVNSAFVFFIIFGANKITFLRLHRLETVTIVADTAWGTLHPTSA